MKRIMMMVLGTLVGACSGGTEESPQSAEGTIEDLSEYLQWLLNADPVSNPILVIQVAGAEDQFIQYSVGEDSVQLDHPLITEQQQKREEQVREALIETGCLPEVNVGSDGSRFLDCELPRVLERIREVSEDVLRSGLGVTAADRLIFTRSGF